MRASRILAAGSAALLCFSIGPSLRNLALTAISKSKAESIVVAPKNVVFSKTWDRYDFKDAALTGSTLTAIKLEIVNNVSGIYDINVSFDHYTYNWSFFTLQCIGGCDIPDTPGAPGAQQFGYSSLYFILRDANNKPITVDFGKSTISVPFPKMIFPPDGHAPSEATLQVLLDRGHCTRPGAEKVGMYGSATRLSAIPVDADIDSNHYLGPNVGKC